MSGALARTEKGESGYEEFIYDASDDLIRVKFGKGDTHFEAAWDYDADGREVQTTTIGGKHLTTVYDALGRVQKQSLDIVNAFETSFGYRTAVDGSGTPVIASMNHGSKAIVIQYHDDGNIKQITTEAGSVSYVYDNLGQLIRVNDGVHNKTSIYTYDAGFNMISERVYVYTTESVPSGEPITQRTFEYDSVWKDQMICCADKDITYDALGNLTSYDGNTYTWTCGRKPCQSYTAGWHDDPLCL